MSDRPPIAQSKWMKCNGDFSVKLDVKAKKWVLTCKECKQIEERSFEVQYPPMPGAK